MGGFIIQGRSDLPILVLAAVAILFAMGVDGGGGSRRFRVGGTGANWVPDPKQSYNAWAETQRFKKDDTLWFKYKGGEDSVFWVTDVDYASCNVSRPVRNYTDGDTLFPLFHSGPFYFISGVEGHCARGQKLVVVVLADRSIAPVSPSPSSPSPSPRSPLSPPTQPPSAPSPSQPPSAPPAAEPSPSNAPAPPPAKSASSRVHPASFVAVSLWASSIVFLSVMFV